jgi:hypothetical protein
MKTETERTLERRTAARKTIMSVLFAVIVLAVVGGFVYTANNSSNAPIVAEQDLQMPDIDRNPLMSPPEEPLPAPTLPPVPLPDASNTNTPATPLP